MTEGLATATGVPNAGAGAAVWPVDDGRSGLLLSGNIQVDADHLERPGDVVIDREPDARCGRRWPAGRRRQPQWQPRVQISHARPADPEDRQPAPEGPLGGGWTCQRAVRPTGGVDHRRKSKRSCAGLVSARRRSRRRLSPSIQVHAAHGYLLSEFLSPRSNCRTTAMAANWPTGRGPCWMRSRRCARRGQPFRWL